MEDNFDHVPIEHLEYYPCNKIAKLLMDNNINPELREQILDLVNEARVIGSIRYYTGTDFVMDNYYKILRGPQNINSASIKIKEIINEYIKIHKKYSKYKTQK